MKKARLIVDSSEKNSDILYACGFMALDSYIYFECDGIKQIIVSALEFNRAENETFDDVQVINSSIYKKRDTENLLNILTQKHAITHFEVPQTFPLVYADILRKNNINVKCVKNLFFPQRSVKNQLEIKKITAGLRIAENAMNRAYEIIAEASVNNKKHLIWEQEVLTSEVLRSEIEISIIKQGGRALETIASSGIQCSEPHNTGSGIIFAEQPIILDIFPKTIKDGYYGDLTRTYVKGKAFDELKRAFFAVKEARDTAKENVCNGVKAIDVHNIAKNILNERGFPTGIREGINYGFFHGLGHGVGLDIHESPNVSPSNKGVLLTGNVITIEPGVYYKEWGGVRLEDMVVVQDNGCQYLNNIDTTLEII